MKTLYFKKLYFTLAFTAITVVSFAQDIEIFKEGQTVDVSGTMVSASWSNPDMKKILVVKNSTNAAKDLKVTRKKLVEVPGALDYLCWGISLNPGEGQCYPSDLVSPFDPWTSPDSYTYGAGQEGILWVYHTPMGNSGCAMYRYIIEENGVALDSIDVEFCYFLSVKSEKPTSISVFPNPANDVVNVNIENLNGVGSVSIYDIAGKVVTESAISNGNNQLDISALNAGVYFYTVRNNEGVIETKKLLVQ